MKQPSNLRRCSQYGSPEEESIKSKTRQETF